jgi:hypothetical protein
MEDQTPPFQQQRQQLYGDYERLTAAEALLVTQNCALHAALAQWERKPSRLVTPAKHNHDFAPCDERKESDYGSLYAQALFDFSTLVISDHEFPSILSCQTTLTPMHSEPGEIPPILGPNSLVAGSYPTLTHTPATEGQSPYLQESPVTLKQQEALQKMEDWLPMGRTHLDDKDALGMPQLHR